MDIKIAEIGDYADIIKFSGKVFHQNFKKIVPKIYAAHPEKAQNHLILKDGDNLIGSLLAEPVKMHLADKLLSGIGIGTVAVDKKQRGKGIMDKLMRAAVAKAEAEAVDFMYLAGLRQRYERYGFVRSGIVGKYMVCKYNLARIENDKCISFADVFKTDAEDIAALRARQMVYCDADYLLQSYNTWNSHPTAVFFEGQLVGIINGRDQYRILLDETVDILSVLKAYLLFIGKDSIVLYLDSFQKVQKGRLLSICEDYFVQTCTSLKIINYENVITAFLSLENDLPDGNIIIEILGKNRFEVKSSGGIATVKKTVKPADVSFDEQTAVIALFGDTTHFYCQLPDFKKYFPVNFGGITLSENV